MFLLDVYPDLLLIPDIYVSWLPALIGGIAGIGSTILGGIFSSKSQSSANRQNIQLAQMQNQWNIDQWNRENAYNTPTEQMKRLRDAGINPNLAYSNGSISNVAASSPQAAPAKVSPYLGYSEDFRSIIPAILQGAQAFEQYKKSVNENKLSETQVDYIKADILNKRAQTEKIFEEKLGLSYDNYLKKELQQFNVEMFKTQLEDAKTNVEIKRIDKDIKAVSLSYSYAQLEQIGETIKKVKQEVANLKTDNVYKRQLYERERLDNQLRRQGINPSDPILYRMLGKAIENPQYASQLVDNLLKLQSTLVGKSRDYVKNTWDKVVNFFGDFDVPAFVPTPTPQSLPGFKAR